MQIALNDCSTSGLKTPPGRVNRRTSPVGERAREGCRWSAVELVKAVKVSDALQESARSALPDARGGNSEEAEDERGGCGAGGDDAVDGDE